MNKDGWIAVGLAVALLALPIGLAVLTASFEAASYRKFCDAPVTTWDALWLD